MIEQIIIKKTLKAGNQIWEEGSVINSPLPKVLIEEANLKTGTVEITKGRDEGKLIFVAQKADKREGGTTQTSKYPGPPKINKLKPKLRRRK